QVNRQMLGLFGDQLCRVPWFASAQWGRRGAGARAVAAPVPREIDTIALALIEPSPALVAPRAALWTAFALALTALALPGSRRTGRHAAGFGMETLRPVTPPAEPWGNLPMKMDDTQRVPAPQAKVWAALND